MDSKHHEKRQLITDLDRSRIVLKEDLRATFEGLNFPARIKSAVRDAPFRWLGGAAAVGIVAGGLFRGSSKSRLKAKHAKALAKRLDLPAPGPGATPPPAPGATVFSGMAMELLKFSFLAAKPLLLAYASSKAADFAAQLKMRDKQRRK